VEVEKKAAVVIKAGGLVVIVEDLQVTKVIHQTSDRVLELDMLVERAGQGQRFVG